eukprot:CAMPEP_0206057710 /NCGR_PEP_ID=MMETSP1466-20131121/44928_1 /ASSEMBLY_ACC=CAM_ASM_001126 /TAXON_ID=44452 /ORGANISM="Pavlova gyrans, Strain CCMP608" /LENGTH=33 /DNA_ID= /DNA_START= /DNA_END= /DNA_ORIENTATION=
MSASGATAFHGDLAYGDTSLMHKRHSSLVSSAG